MFSQVAAAAQERAQQLTAAIENVLVQAATPGVEVRLTCKTLIEIEYAIKIIMARLGKDDLVDLEKSKVSALENSSFELTNGSAIRFILAGAE